MCESQRYNGPEKSCPVGGNAYEYHQAGKLVTDFSANIAKMMARGRSFAQTKQVLLDEVGGNFDAFLTARKPDQPFLYWFGPANTHRPFVKGSGDALWGINPDKLKNKLPIFLPDGPEIRRDMADYLRHYVANAQSPAT